MADLKKFEEMLQKLVNEDKAGAEELFHEIVVEKSRDIYESLLEDDLEDEEVDEATDEEVDESDEDLDEADDEEVDESDDELEEGFDLEEFEVEADPADMGGDPADDMMGDVEMPDEDGDDEDGDDEGEEGDVEDRVMDLEDALEDLKAEFDAMMSGDDAGDDAGDDEGEDEMDMDMDDMGMDMDAEEEPEEESFQATITPLETKSAKLSAGEQMREYVEKVSATMGDGGANTKSSVAGANNMGGTASNLNQAGTDAGVEANKGNLKGSALSDQSPKDMSTGNINVPGGKAAKASKTAPAGHGAEKKGKPEAADKAAGSTLNKVSTRAK